MSRRFERDGNDDDDDGDDDDDDDNNNDDDDDDYDSEYDDDDDDDRMIRSVPRSLPCRFISSRLGTAISTQDNCYSTDPLYWD